MSDSGIYTDSRGDYRQSLPLSWLQFPEERDRASLLEFVRGTVYSLSKKDDGRFEAIHVSRIQNSFKRLGSAALYKVALRLIELLREAEPLFGGYWLLTPYRVIEIEGKFMFVGALPNAHGLLGNVAREGLSRWLPRDLADNFPRQTLENWMGAATQDTSAIVTTFVSGHKRTAVKTSNLPGISCLSVRPTGSKGSHPFRWVDNIVEAIPAQQIAICKQSHHGRTRFFSATVRMGNIISEAPISIGISRLLFAVAAQLGAPVKATIRSGSQSTEITLDARLPIEEFRLALVLSKQIIRSGQSTTFIIPANLAPAFSMRLADLGCSLETMQ